VTEELTRRFINGNAWGTDSTTTLKVLDVASLPEHGRISVNSYFIAGLFSGLLIGAVIVAVVVLFRRSPAPV
jgi:hypothetical protein